MNQFKSRQALVGVMVMALSILPVASHAAGAHGGHSGHANFGSPAQVSAAGRTINVVMHDNYFEPESLSVEPGETVLFRISNKGNLVHEFSLGTPETHAASDDEMQMFVAHGVIQGNKLNRSMMTEGMGNGHSMSHAAPHRVLLAPGEEAEIAWTFAQAGAQPIEFACNVPGHYAAGMVGDVAVE
ncbi:plastocyanin/azurin family copper-binding protein [Marinobacter nanhaiticus D15-8W]|nr:plastocyanin/azurin family copper-binding protein [Marinobacter nanhaiticus]BES72259.1 plastocyanin/azurin family copper-binding protein [Marinobacter nanhaiticus D15-8W]